MVSESMNIELLSLFSTQQLPYPLHSGLTCFGENDEQYSRLQRLLAEPYTQVCIAVHEEKVIGYATLLPPEPAERWSSLPYVRIMGVLEVAPPYRGRRVAYSILQHLFRNDEDIERRIVLAFEYYWHWDLKNSGLNAYEYKNMLKQLLMLSGMEEVYPDDPDIHAHAANFAMARIGREISAEQMQRFFYMINPRVW
ncbi:GNAT family N-acetyltransferase [Aneurinibacillus aneurinilyticus]|uniref:Acetoin utilization protein AcuA family protein n=1 Tax=Aneurinibacillus aneurinilyticus ATCC 12856 TaxID=649747 RepID=U1X872_ANEAE|nr:GNAT family N-acetyltransferase [Aneurinibacillus aneurinilyticus]ERI11165.1 acetoin utilization protein AcuA family protein [Aneurinibacillus aneurinilyticus ATCC 12856]MED0704845.1 GNAT family N-acetyltransferase [Aneurinibacillus aneurinilyticus]MED0723831.1 GNAT family N-acetyltransferase [Aneurinibacillus aneurinilyticus]MED0731096.1 GNAT family N-acetyltransferase [Aneurinibacillus aneurinilyticus]MED0740636.1 GNAT family N-acetyltransferase [Aneurinibacillus aneurinilyticus]